MGIGSILNIDKRLYWLFRVPGRACGKLVEPNFTNLAFDLRSFAQAFLFTRCRSPVLLYDTIFQHSFGRRQDTLLDRI